MFNFNVAFFRPIWVRIVTVLVCFGWGAFEYANGSPRWAMLFAGLGALAFYQLFFNWKDPDNKD